MVQDRLRENSSSARSRDAGRRSSDVIEAPWPKRSANRGPGQQAAPTLRGQSDSDRPTLHDVRERLRAQLKSGPELKPAEAEPRSGPNRPLDKESAERPERRLRWGNMLGNSKSEQSPRPNRPERIATPEPEPRGPLDAVRGLFGGSGDHGGQHRSDRKAGGPLRSPSEGINRGRMSFSDLRRRIEARNRRPAPGDAGPNLPARFGAERPGVAAGLSARDFDDRAGSSKIMRLRGSSELAQRWLAGNAREIRRSFVEQIHRGQHHARPPGPVGRKIRLNDQLASRRRGDVARRLGLTRSAIEAVSALGPPAHRTVHHRNRFGPHWGPPSNTNLFTAVTNLSFQINYPYRGHLSPSYAHGIFRYWYTGPRYFGYHCWYPRWTHWVAWSWAYRCPSVWDPRPVWCRPVLYKPAPVWVWWDCPQWVALPVVSSGTWVDIEPVDVGPAFDVQLLAIRFVDPGHPEEALGPRYRVWFRNNSETALSEPFSVVLLASADEQLTEGLPHAGVEVESIEAGEVQSVDIRLPLEVMSFGAESNLPQAEDAAPFAWLHAIVDANRRITETDETNNGVRIERGEVLPVDPAAFELDPSEAAGGAEVIIAGEGFGPEPGQVLLSLGEIEMECAVLGWYDLGVKLELPTLPLSGATVAELIVVRGADGAAANPLQILILPGQGTQ